MKHTREKVIAALFALAVPATATAQTSFWDFVALNGAPAQGPTGQVLYNSRVVSNGLYGSVLFTAQLGAGSNVNNSPLVGFQYFQDDQGPDDEKGVGICMKFGPPANPAGPCNAGGEIGESYNETLQNGPEWLLLDLTGLTPGSTFHAVTLASLQNTQTYYFQVCADNAFLVNCSTYAGAGNHPTKLIYTINLPSSDWDKRFARFGVGTNHVGAYALQAITTSVPEPGTMGLLASGLVVLAGASFLRRRKSGA